VPKAPSYRSLLVGVDFSPASRRAVAHAAVLARALKARIELLHVVPKLKPAIPFSGTNREVVARLQRQSRDQADKRLKKLAAGLKDLRVGTTVRTGKPSEQILSQASRCKAEMVVIAERSQSAAEHLLLGSTAERVVRHACGLSVLVVPYADSD
jgi:nucleotide-binding universal stress UspA family protein